MMDEMRPLVTDVLLTPAELGGELRVRPTDVAVVIDVIRATTTLAVLFDRGCARVLVAGDMPAARAFAADHPGAYLLAGEVGGLRPPGFDFGNSPVELAAADLSGREVIFCTTNGTRALHACAGAGARAPNGSETGRTRRGQAPAAVGAGAILAGSLRNAQAVCQAALRHISEMPSSQTPRLLFVCSGRLGRPAVDDTLCAGVLLEHLERLASAAGCALRLRDGAHLARRAAAGTPVPADLLRASAAGRAVTKIGLEHDLAFCAEVAASQSVARVVGTNAAGFLIMERATL
jgi:2-phosphosulfolactate phosphatase